MNPDLPPEDIGIDPQIPVHGPFLDQDNSRDSACLFANIAALCTDLQQCDDARSLAKQVLAGFQPAAAERFQLIWWLNSVESQLAEPALAIHASTRALVNAALRRPGRFTKAPSGGITALSIFDDTLPFGAALVDRSGATPDPVIETVLNHPQVQRIIFHALEREYLHSEVTRLQRSEKIQYALFAISEMSGSDIEMSAMLEGMHRIVGQLMYAESFFIASYYPQRNTVQFIYFADPNESEPPSRDEVPLENFHRSRTWYVIQDRKPIMGDPDQIAAQVSGPLGDFGADSLDWLGVPMVTGQQVRGAMVVQSYIRRPRYTQEDQALLSFVGNQILTALDRKQAKEDLEHRVSERTQELHQEIQERKRSERLQETLFRIAELSNTAESIDRFYEEIRHIVNDLMDARNFYIALLSDDGLTLHFPYFVDEREPHPAPRALGMGITEHVLRTGRPYLMQSSTTSNAARPQGDEKAPNIVRGSYPSLSWLGVPLVRADRTVGVIAVQSYTDSDAYSSRDRDLLQFISYQIANGLERQRASSQLRQAYEQLEARVQERTQQLSEQIAVREAVEKRLKHEVVHDALTGLPNRTYLRDTLNRVIARSKRHPGQRFAVMFMDLDRFKVINDSAGHLVGDQLLKAIATRLSECVRVPDIVARLGGDEFAILLDDLPTEEDAVQLASRIVRAIEVPLVIEGREFFTSISIGIAMSDPRYSKPDEYLRDADIAMYRAKKTEGRHVVVFNEGLHAQALDELELDGDLRRAILRHEFEPYFQPIVRLADGGTVGYEALIRWNHPQRGVLLPGSFLAAARVSGILEQIDWLMFEATCKALETLLEPGEYVNLNFAPQHFSSSEFENRFLALLARYKVEPGIVRVEVTEGALVENPDQASEKLEYLREGGVLAALDDFGTGYSSLSYLHRFRFHTVKIDRSFVKELDGPFQKNSVAVIRAILALASSLDLEVVAEGIETSSQCALLAELGCQLGQGYLFSEAKAATNYASAT